MASVSWLGPVLIFVAWIGLLLCILLDHPFGRRRTKFPVAQARGRAWWRIWGRRAHPKLVLKTPSDCVVYACYIDYCNDHPMQEEDING